MSRFRFAVLRLPKRGTMTRYVQVGRSRQAEPASSSGDRTTAGQSMVAQGRAWSMPVESRRNEGRRIARSFLQEGGNAVPHVRIAGNDMPTRMP
jgi:hypothetical protein